MRKVVLHPRAHCRRMILWHGMRSGTTGTKTSRSPRGGRSRRSIPPSPSVWRRFFRDVTSARPPGIRRPPMSRLAMDVEGADTGGADRALAVLAALAHMPPGQPGLVVSCGTAITIERVTAEGVWQGGVIAPGLFLCARALHLLTAQLPLVHPDQSAPSWGRGTLPSLEAGVFWGTVGSIRELARPTELRA